MASQRVQDAIDAVAKDTTLTDGEKKEVAAGVVDAVGGLPQVTSPGWAGVIYTVALVGLIGFVFVFGLIAVNRGNDTNTGGQDIAIAIATSALGAFIGLFVPSPVANKK